MTSGVVRVATQIKNYSSRACASCSDISATDSQGSEDRALKASGGAAIKNGSWIQTSSATMKQSAPRFDAGSREAILFS